MNGAQIITSYSRNAIVLLCRRRCTLHHTWINRIETQHTHKSTHSRDTIKGRYRKSGMNFLVLNILQLSFSHIKSHRMTKIQYTHIEGTQITLPYACEWTEEKKILQLFTASPQKKNWLQLFIAYTTLMQRRTALVIGSMDSVSKSAIYLFIYLISSMHHSLKCTPHWSHTNSFGDTFDINNSPSQIHPNDSSFVWVFIIILSPNGFSTTTYYHH